MHPSPVSMHNNAPDFGPGSDHELASLTPIVEADIPPSSSLPISKNRYGVEETALLDSTETTSSFTNNTDAYRKPNGWRYRVGLGRYFPLRAPDDANPPFRGWRKTAITAAIVVGCVLAINATFAIVARIKFSAEDGVGLIYTGDCDLVRRWDTAIHLSINLLGTVLLAASSFTMQCLNSPTRNEVDVAHSNNKPLEIGLASLTNLLHVKRWRAILWLLLCLSTMPLHLLWNSTIFSTASANLFSFVIADESFLHGASYRHPNDTLTGFCYDAGGPFNSSNGTPSNVINTIYNGYKAGLYSNLTAADCFKYYVGGGYLSRRRNLIIVIQQPTASDFMGMCGYEGQPWNGSSVLGVGINWFPGDRWPQRIGRTYIPSTESNGTWSLDNHTVISCKSELSQSSSYCQLQFMSYTLYVVLGSNLVKLLCMCITIRYLWNLNEPILATIGDATCSFLETPDEMTKGLCLLDYEDVNKKVWKDKATYNPVYRREKKRRLYFATTHTRWWSTMIPCTLYLVVGFVLWHGSMSLAHYGESETMKLAFGEVDANLLLKLRGASGQGLLVDIIVANSFQLALSTTYFLYNSLYSAQYAAIEWASYVQGKPKPLRVTYPRGQQRSTYYLQLPYRYAIPLTTLLTIMHFLISQSIFLARLQYYDWAGMPYSEGSFTDVGFSPRANLTTCLVGLVLILAQIAHSLRPLDNRIPIHGNTSAVISAMCHIELDSGTTQAWEDSRGTPEADSVSTRPITWGVTRYPVKSSLAQSTGIDADGEIRDGAGHCSFSPDRVWLPQTGKKYR